MVRWFIFLAFLGFGLNIPYAFAQFSFDRISDYEGYGIERPVKFWTTPRYNRVEGLFVNPGLEYYPTPWPNTKFYGYIGAGLWNESDQIFRFRVGARKDFMADEFTRRFSLGAEVFHSVQSVDDWTVGYLENSLYALVAGQDYKDYFSATGFKVYFDYKLKEAHTLRFEFARRKFEALRKNIDWSVFGNAFPANPRRADAFIAEGNEIGMRFMAAFDWRDNPMFPLTGWYLEAIYEPTFEDFKTQGLFLTLKAYRPTWSNQRLLARVMLGTRSGDIAGPRASGAPVDSLADQYAIDLGGLGTLRGFDDKEFMGNRMFMLNFNYWFGGDILQKIPLRNVPLFGTFWSTLSLGLFVDTGWAWVSDPDRFLLDGFGALRPANLKTDVGVSLAVLEGVVRLDVAKRTDRSRDDFRVTLRILEKM